MQKTPVDSVEVHAQQGSRLTLQQKQRRMAEMKTKKWAHLLVVTLAITFLSGCAMTPRTMVSCTEPVNGRQFQNLGRTRSTNSKVSLFGIIPISGSNNTRDAIDTAVESKGGDAMVNLVVETYSQNWILFTRLVTSADGNVIKFQK